MPEHSPFHKLTPIEVNLRHRNILTKGHLGSDGL